MKLKAEEKLERKIIFFAVKARCGNEEEFTRSLDHVKLFTRVQSYCSSILLWLR
jgi:hypothetical protein